MKLYNINFLEDLDITSNVILALLYYKRNERLSQQAIMNAFKISKKSVYNHLKILEKNEYIKIRSIGKVGEKVQYKTILTTKTMTHTSSEAALMPTTGNMSWQKRIS